MVRPLRAEIPIYLAAIGPKNVELAAEIADGWLPIFFSPERARETFPAPFARETGSTSRRPCPASSSDDVQTGARRAASRTTRCTSAAWARAARTSTTSSSSRATATRPRRSEIQDLFLDGKQRDAAAAVPDALVDEVALVGPRERIAERLDAWRESGATTLLVSTRDAATLRVRGGGCACERTSSST